MEPEVQVADQEVMITPVIMRSDVKLNQRQQIQLGNKDQKSECNTRMPTTAMAIEREKSGEDELYDNLEDALQNVENDFIIRKAQMQQIRQQNKKK